jgi:hypothetical protein
MSKQPDGLADPNKTMKKFTALIGGTQSTMVGRIPRSQRQPSTER